MRPPYSSLEHLARSILPNKDWARCWMIMTATTSAFTGYFDDSGHPDDQLAVIVAGHIATVEQWLIFEREWNQIMGVDSNGVSRVFHMKDLSKEEWSKLLPALISVITRRVRMQFSITVPMDEYLQVNSLYTLEEWFGKPYAFAGRTLCVMIRAWESKYNLDRLPLKIVFEDGTKHKGDLIDVMNRDNDCPFPIFERKKDVVALQSADLLAWQMLSIYKNDFYVQPEFEKLLKHPHDFSIYTKENLIDTCKAASLPLRSEMPPGKTFAYYSSLKKARSRNLTYSTLDERDKILAAKRDK